MKKIKIPASSIAVALLAIAFVTQTFSIVKVSKGLSVGPAGFPRTACIALFILALLDVVKETHKSAEETEVGNLLGKLKERGIIKLMISVLVFFLMAQLMKPVGFIPCGIIFLFVQICLCTEKLDKPILIRYFVISIVLTVASFVIFNYGFDLRIPQGILNF